MSNGNEHKVLVGQEGEIVKKVFCLTCGVKHPHIIIAHRYVDKEYLLVEDDLLDENYTTGLFYVTAPSIAVLHFSQLISCRECKTVSMRKIVIEVGENEPYEDIIIPLRKDKILKPELKDLIASRNIQVTKIFQEAISCYNNGLNFSASAALRTTLEVICIDRRHKDNLFEKFKIREAKETAINVEDITAIRLIEIKKMIGLEMMVRELIKELNKLKKREDYNVLHTIREWGNEHMHEGKIPNSIDIKDAIELLEFIIITLYDHSESVEQKFVRVSSNFKGRR